MFSVLGKIIKLLFYALTIALLVTVSVANHDEATLSFFPLPYEVTLPKYLLCILIFLIGLVFGALYYASEILRANRTIRKERKQVEALEQEVTALKAAPRPNVNTSHG